MTELADATIRQIGRVSAAGTGLRLRLPNENGIETVFAPIEKPNSDRIANPKRG